MAIDIAPSDPAMAPPAHSSPSADARRWRTPVLAYHRIGDPRGDHVPTVTAEAFAAQLQWIDRLGYRVAPFDQYISSLTGGAALPPRSIVITFDDGYVETATIAAGLLQQHGMPAIVFVTPMELGTSGFMDWEQVAAITRQGLTIGSHTMHHTYLPLVSLAQARQEIFESRRVLSARLGTAIDWLSYPVGGFTSEIQALAREAGYRAACTTNRGHSKHARDLFALRRIKMTDRDRHPLSLVTKLSGLYNAFRQVEQPA